MAVAVYVLGTLVTALCAALLLRAYLHARRRLLLWSGVCFAGLTVANALVFVDLVVLPEVDLRVWRLAAAALAMGVLLYALIWESE